MKAFVRALPKVETHLHLDGTLTPDLIQSLARSQGHELGNKTVEEIAALAVVSTPWPSLAAVLEAFVRINPLLHRADALDAVAYELCRKAAAQNIRYMEVRFAPILHFAPGFNQDAVMTAVLGGLAKGKRDFGVGSGVIVTMLRNLSVEDNESIYEVAKRFFGRGVVALDLANDEARRPLSQFAHLYQDAKSAGLSTTVHAGEVYPCRDFESALDLGIDRIGHGVFLT
ncbi:MAG: adenosine deaminase, partial [Elusimicrobiota bacterium]